MPGEVVVCVDTAKLLPHTDPFNRQITSGMGCFLELMRMAASHDDQRVEITPFPEGYGDKALDARPVARAVFTADPSVSPDPLFEVMGATGLFTREVALDTSSQAYKAGLEAVYANTDTAMGIIWLVTEGNSRPAQIATGADWLRVNLSATAAGVAFQPLSQAIQKYPEMAALYTDLHARLAAGDGTVQMLARIGYGLEVAASPRWPLEAKIINA